MTVIAGSHGSIESLDVVLRRAGAVLATRDGRPVAMNFGSAAAELAVCVRAVGLVDRSELSKLVLEAPSAQLAVLTSRLAGDAVSPGGVLCAGNAWWCGDAPGRVIVLSDPDAGARLRDRLHVDVRRFAGITVRDASAELAAIAVLGRGASDVLRALGAYGEAWLGIERAGRPFGISCVGYEAACRYALLERIRPAVPPFG